MGRLTATEVARNLSAVLGGVSNGERVEVVRNGVPVAIIAPPEARAVSATAFRDLLDTLPTIDETFVGEMDRLRDVLGPPEERWPS
jgi:antitoxin (DNA-binding transcriptional repressor) of toxin-antitoxin stability system